MRNVRTIVSALATVTLVASAASAAMAQSPAVSPAPIVGDGDTWFSGTLTFDGRPLPGQPVTHLENGLWVTLGSGFEGQSIQSSDPRMSGKRTVYRSDVTSDPSDSVPGFTRLLALIEAGDGTWTCDLVEVRVEGGSDVQSGWCHGADAHEGLRAYVVFDLGASGTGDSIPVTGYVTSGGGLELPAAPPR